MQREQDAINFILALEVDTERNCGIPYTAIIKENHVDYQPLL